MASLDTLSEQARQEPKRYIRPNFKRETAQRVANSIAKLIKGDVLWDDWQRVMYATDASSYEILPLCVVIPRTAEDVVNVVRFAHEQGISVIPRGGGSGLVGGALGSGIVFDFSKYMNKIITIHDESITCEPGIFRDNLESAVEKEGLTLPVNPSSSAYCCIGGMIGANASGAHSLKYGHTIDYLESLDLVLYDGTLVNLEKVNLDGEDWKKLRDAGNSNHRSRIYNELFDLVSKSQETIKRSMPKVSKNSAGYRLDLALDEEKRTFNPAKVVCGSEGTFGIVVRAKFRLIKKPKKRGFLILRYDSFKSMGDAIPSITKHHPSATELMDKSVIDAASVLNPQVKDLNKGDKQIALIVEFNGDDQDEITRQLKNLQEEISKENKNESEIITDQKEIERIWNLREESLGFAYKVREGERRTEGLIEDTVVPPEKLGEYLGELMRIYKEMGLKQMSWGHVSEGNIHTRPFLNYKSAEDLKKAKELADKIYSLVASYNGSSTGEHSDGILRAPYIKIIYNEEMIEIFKNAKRIFDPSGLMNPGKKVDSLDESPLRDLRYGENYATKPSAGVYVMNWGMESTKVIKDITGRDTALDFEHEVESCFGCGRCREQSNTSRMCPVYDAQYEEISACRGRNNLLRWMNKIGGLASEFSTTKEYGKAIYENCIQCKMCLIDCPANTDVGKLMAEARARYAKVRGIPKGYKFFFDLDRYANYGCAIAPISNWAMKNPFLRFMTEKVAGIDRRKNFPPFHRERFVQLFNESHARMSPDDVKGNENGYVIFFYDTYLNYNDPNLGMRIVEMFEKNGLQVIVPEQKSSGMPAIIEGDPAKGRKYAKLNVSSLAPFASKGVKIVTFSPSAGLTLKNDYLDVYDTAESRAVSENTLDIHEFLCELDKNKLLRKEIMKPTETKKCFVHMHCHTIVQHAEDKVKEALSYIPELKFDILENGCCGNGGSYSFIAGNYLRSMKMGRGLIEDIKRSRIPVYSTGESCKVQLEQGARKSVGLTSELLCESFGV